MSKSIKLTEEVYRELSQFCVGHETFSQAVHRLLQLHKQERRMLESLGGKPSKEKGGS